jgi:3-phytase/alkaline phosphatase D
MLASVLNLSGGGSMKAKTGVRVLVALGVVLFLGRGVVSGSGHGTARTFPNGVASGDVTTTSVVLWARSSVRGPVSFEVARDPWFRDVRARRWIQSWDPQVPVKALVGGLAPGSRHYFRATAANGRSAQGTFVTATPPGRRNGLRFGVSGDWRGELAPYPAVANAKGRGLDFFVLHGDTIYADYPSPALPLPQAETLEDYRLKHAEVYGERFGLNTLADLRAGTSVLATIDDHEVTNDFAGGAPIGSDDRFSGDPDALINDSELFENGLSAFQEYNPVRDLFYRTPGDPRTDDERRLFRYRQWGDDAAVLVLDTRSFRDPGLAPANPFDPTDVGRFLVQSFDPRRTLLGRAQVEQLKRGLLRAHRRGVTWKFVMVPEPIQNLGPVGASDRFEGYAAERTEILRFIRAEGIRNVVFVAADIHGTLVNNLTYQESPFGPQIPTDAFEVTTGAVAFDAPFGPTVVELAQGLGLLTPVQVAYYGSLPREGKDAFVAGLVNSQVAPFGYDSLGLAGSPVAAELRQGGWAAVHVFGWTEFRIDARSQKLSVDTWGIDPYTEADLSADPAGVIDRRPRVVSSFTVDPKAP